MGVEGIDVADVSDLRANRHGLTQRLDAYDACKALGGREIRKTPCEVEQILATVEVVVHDDRAHAIG